MCSFITFWACRATKGKAGEAGSLGCGDHQGDCVLLFHQKDMKSQAQEERRIVSRMLVKFSFRCGKTLVFSAISAYTLLRTRAMYWNPLFFVFCSR